MAGKQREYYESYRYPTPVPAVAGKHGKLSVQIRREPDGWWRWELTEDESHLLKTDRKIGLEDAMSEAVYYLKEFLAQKGEPERLFSLNPDTWLAEGNPRNLSQRSNQERRGFGFRRK